MQQNDTQLNDADTTQAISEERNALTIEETVVGTPAHMLNNEIISTLEKKFETFSMESRLLNIEQQIIGARNSRIVKISDLISMLLVRRNMFVEIINDS